MKPDEDIVIAELLENLLKHQRCRDRLTAVVDHSKSLFGLRTIFESDEDLTEAVGEN